MNLEELVEDGVLKKLCLVEVAQGIDPTEYRGKIVRFVLRREDGVYSLFDEDHHEVAE